MENNGVKFLNKLYKDLNLSEEVKHISKGTKNKDEAVHKYIERLEYTHKQAINKNKIDLLKYFYYKKYVVKEKDIPRYRDKQRIINAQKESLSSWLNYLLDENTRYPMWAKYWAFQGMLKIGTYNEATGTYQKRSKKTLAPFIDVNPEVLARCISMVVDYVENKELTDNELNKLVESGNFQKLYTILQKEHTKKLSNIGDINDGIWITYHYETEETTKEKQKNGIVPEYLKLYNSLQGCNTGWCTAGSVETAKDQICGIKDYEGGNFYVYYTKDEKNGYKVPRIAIRMENDYIGEIRGIEDGQNLEEGLEEIVEKKLNNIGLTLNEIDSYSKIIKNMKKLTELNKKQKKKEEFTIDDIKFLYEINGLIEGFGWEQDLRIEKIRKERIGKKDLLKIPSEEIIESFKYFGFLSLEYVPSNIKNYEEIALVACSSFYGNIRFLDEKIECYNNIVIKSLKKDIRGFRFIPEHKRFNLINEKELALKLVNYNGECLKYISKNIDGYQEIVMKGLENDIKAFEYVKEKIDFLITDYEIARKLVKYNSEYLKYISPTIKINNTAYQGYNLYCDIVELASYCSKRIEINENGEEKMISGECLKYVPTDIEDYDEIIIDSLLKGTVVLKYVPITVKNYWSIAVAAISLNGENLKYIPIDYENYQVLVEYAIKINKDNIKYVPSNIKNYNEIKKLVEYKQLENNGKKR